MTKKITKMTAWYTYVDKIQKFVMTSFFVVLMNQKEFKNIFKKF